MEALRAAGAMEHTTVVSCAPEASLAERYAATAAVRGRGSQEGGVALPCVLCVYCALSVRRVCVEVAFEAVSSRVARLLCVKREFFFFSV